MILQHPGGTVDSTGSTISGVTQQNHLFHNREKVRINKQTFRLSQFRATKAIWFEHKSSSVVNHYLQSNEVWKHLESVAIGRANPAWVKLLLPKLLAFFTIRIVRDTQGRDMDWLVLKICSAFRNVFSRNVRVPYFESSTLQPFGLGFRGTGCFCAVAMII